MMRRIVLSFVVSLFVLSTNYGQDSITALPGAINVSIMFSKEEKTLLLHAYTLEYMKFKTLRKITSWETGGNYSRAVLPFALDSIPNRSAMTSTHFTLMGWRNYRYILGKAGTGHSRPIWNAI